MFEGVTKYPLYWPEGWKRTESHRRSKSRYKADSFAVSRDWVFRQLGQMRGEQIVVSSNIPLRRDGLPSATFNEPADPGVAIFWVRREFVNGKRTETPQTMACDVWKKTWENMRAIGHALDALRSLERCGASQILERAFTGFAALPEATATIRPWFAVFEVQNFNGHTDRATYIGAIRKRYLELTIERHPDRRGSTERMAELNLAYAEFRKEFGI